ncbi:MAG: tRNA lysidine(34) synthetase TilS [Candidatus Acidiferrales bacterium]|jgi:tRNA(Ile)-lysidine synthase
MKSELHHGILETIRRHRMLIAGDRVGVAVSGGADSVALLRLIEDLQDELGIGLCALHLNHGLRGEASDADAAFVANLARTRGLELFSEREDVAAEARRNHWNLEDSGRRARYSFFERAVASGHCKKVAVAHTADDQAETVLGRVLRGAGPRGIVGIHPVRGSVVRPLLDIRRIDLRAYLTAKGQDWREDATNQDTTRLRARLRHELLPQLERDFNPAIIERLASLSAISRDEEAFWNLLVDDSIRELTAEIPEGLSIGVADLLAPRVLISKDANAARALSRRIIQGLFAKIASDSAGLQFGHVEDVLHLADASQSGRRVELPHGVNVVRNFDRLEFIRRAAPKASSSEGTFSENLRPYQYAVALTSHGVASIDVPELGLRFSLKAIDWPLRESDTTCETGVLDADRLTPPLVLRNWRPGDAYRLPGKRQAQKLKRLFLDARVGIPDRERWPVLTSAGRIAWTRGWPPAAEFQAGKETKRRVVVLEEKL